MTTAAEDAKTQQAALLQAIAEQGTRGAQYYQQAAQAAQTQRQSDVQAALDRAQTQGGPGAAGAPVALQAQLGAQAAAPGDQRAADIAQAATYQAQDQQALSNANDTYMNQVGAAIPIVATKVNAQAAQAAKDNALRRELEQLQLEQSQLGLESSRVNLQNQREAGQRAAEAAANPKLSVAEQKYLDDQATQERQQNVITMADNAPGTTRAAFYDIVRNNETYADAQAFINEGRNTFAPSTTGWTGPYNSFDATYPGVDMNTLQSLLAAFYGMAAPVGDGQSTIQRSGSY